jgi:glycosyltransferase involved in cell wall biosynthesis
MSKTDKSRYGIADVKEKMNCAIITDNTKEYEALEQSFDDGLDLVCLSHLRWDFVYQRPQHLLSRCARERRVFFIEEPLPVEGQMARLDVTMRDCGVSVVVPRLPEGLSAKEVTDVQRLLIDELFQECRIADYILWYYTPMAVPFTRHLNPIVTVFDCMDELSAFKFAPPALKELEAELLSLANVVFTGGQSLYEAKCNQHSNIHPFPSSIDAAHFAQARSITKEPDDQASIPHPRIGYFGVIDERMDLALLDQVALARPDWHMVMVGPVVKIDPADLPRRPNIHYLGPRNYEQLPEYLAGWDVCWLPFAINESTRFISPTKTPEYLAAGKPVVSTPIRDVIRPYGEMKLVHVAETGAEFVTAIEAILNQQDEQAEWLLAVDQFISQNSWDQTWMRMMKMIDDAACARGISHAKPPDISPVERQVAKIAGSSVSGD